MTRPLRLGLIGLGNIGSGVIQVLRDNADLLDRRCPRRLELRRVADIDPKRLQLAKLDNALATTNADDVVGDPDVDAVIELIGGIEPARTIIEQAILSGKHVVTANKAVLAQHGAELLELAARKGVRLLFEAAVGGGVPVVRGLCECLAANRITRIEGILNGTCNYILSVMTSESLSFDEALATAKRLGYAEPDPTADVEGIDAANKIAILASLAFGYDIRYGDVYREGIGAITRNDILWAAQEEMAIKQCALAELLEQDCVAISVRPTLLSAKSAESASALALLDGVNNGVIISGQPVGNILFAGPGAGPQPTASAVLSDLMWLAQFDSQQNRGTPPPFLTIPTERKPKICSDRPNRRYVLRAMGHNLEDTTVSVVAQILDRCGIRAVKTSLASLEADREDSPDRSAGGSPVVFERGGEVRAIRVSTAETNERDIRQAVGEIEAALAEVEGGKLSGAVIALPCL